MTNLAKNPAYSNKIQMLKRLLPANNAGWDSLSAYPFQPYFVTQKARNN